MSTAAVIAIVIGVVVVLAAVSFFTLARRSDVRGAGALSGETVQRDKSARRATTPAVESAANTAAEVEAAGSANRTTSTALATVGPRAWNSFRGPRRIPRRSANRAASSSTARPSPS